MPDGLVDLPDRPGDYYRQSRFHPGLHVSISDAAFVTAIDANSAISFPSIRMPFQPILSER